MITTRSISQSKESPSPEVRFVRRGAFRFTKLHSKSFMDVGVIDLEPGSNKEDKNSRMMQMAFVVFCGKGRVNVNYNKSPRNKNPPFYLSAGRVWIMPRGESLVPLLALFAAFLLV